ncbi:uncharacterized protein LOC143285717 isoform X2 [Babylonia areolata]|uniref:uncharacterized protein LOC143285717 isoform X2 n=1 Tax=Babylonia areolata TaxID=304850 RepID=UPI003FD24DFB
MAMDEPPSKRNQDIVGMTDKLQCLLKPHLSAHSDQLFSEICTLHQHLAPYQQRNQQGDQENHDGSHLQDLLQPTLNSTDHTVALLSPDGCLQWLRHVAQSGDCGTHQHCLLSWEQRNRLGVVMSLFKTLKEQDCSRWSQIVSQVTKECLPIEVAWQFHTNAVLSLQTIFDSMLKERRQCTHLTEQLIQLCVTHKDGLLNHKILSDVCSHLVQNGFPEKKSENVAFRKVCWISTCQIQACSCTQTSGGRLQTFPTSPFRNSAPTPFL